MCGLHYRREQFKGSGNYNFYCMKAKLSMRNNNEWLEFDESLS
jgi:hypothetical protein